MKTILILIISILLIQCSDKRSNPPINQSEIKDQDVVESVVEETRSKCSVDLNAAILINDTVMLKSLLADGCDVNTILSSKVNYYDGDTTFITAISRTYDYEMSRILLENGANPNISNGEGGSALCSAIAMKKNNLAKLLITYKANVNHFNKFDRYQSPKAAAVISGNFDGLKLLKESGLNLNTQREGENSLIHNSVTRGEFEIAKYLLESGASANEKETPFSPEGDFGDCIACPYEITPLHSAVQLNDSIYSPKFVDLLLKYGANINARNKHELTPLAYIAVDGKASIANHLITNGAEVDAQSIMRSSSYQNNAYLKVLLESEGNPNASTEYYESPLFAAITCCGDGFNETPISERLETIQLLLKHGAVPSENLKKLIKDNERYSEIQFEE